MTMVECETADQIVEAIGRGDTALLMGLVAVTLTDTAQASIVVRAGGLLKLTLDGSRATVKTGGRSQATVTLLGDSGIVAESWDNSQFAVEAFDDSQVALMASDNSQATVMTWGRAHATVRTFIGSQAAVETSDNSHATIKAQGRSQVGVRTWETSLATLHAADSSHLAVASFGDSRIVVDAWDSTSRLPDAVTHVAGEAVATGVPDLLRDVARAALADDAALDMGRWHHCDTAHCIAGWATHLSGQRGAALEARMGPASAGLVLLGRDAAVHFRDSLADARVWLRQFLPEESAPGGKGEHQANPEPFG